MSQKNNDFDIAKLRVGSKATASTTVVEKEISIGYPGKLDYFRTFTGEDFRDTFLVLDDERNRDTYLVHPDMEEELGGDAVYAEVALVATQHGEKFVWIVKHPAYDGEPYAASKFDALDRARTQWVRLRKRQDRQGYDVLAAQGTFPEPNWPDRPFDEILAKVFAGKIVNSLDHPILLRLRGEGV